MLKRILFRLGAQIGNKSIEVIISDSNSTDSTPSAIKEFIDAFPFVKLRHLNSKNNISAKRNAAIQNASTDYVLFLDDDCLPASDFVKSVLNDIYFFSSADIISGLVLYEEKYLFKSKSYRDYKVSRHNKTNDKKGNILEDQRYIVTMNLCVNKMKIQEKGILFDENIKAYGFEDYDFGRKCVSSGLNIIVGNFSILHMEYENTFQTFSSKIYLMGSTSVSDYISSANYDTSGFPFIKIERSVIINQIARFLPSAVLAFFARNLAMILDSLPYAPLLMVRALIIISFLQGKSKRLRETHKGNIDV